MFVTLLDINDHSPVFDRDLYEYTVVEGHYTIPVLLGYVQATDLDEGVNGKVVYSLDTGTADQGV